MTILGIETSCDETAVALVRATRGGFDVVRETVASQIDIHRQYGGVVPEVAARNHLLSIMPLIKQVAGTRAPDVIAATTGPGLITSLLVGATAGRTLAYLWKKPFVSVNHIEGHIYANWIGTHAKPKFPAIVLIVSGGHTELLFMKDHLRYARLGQTRDDAAGEAFDKGAKMLGLGYPGGPAISACAGRGSASRYDFPRPMLEEKGYEFSYSGIKTSLLYRLRDMERKPSKKEINDLCASYQEAIVDVLVGKTLRAVREYRPASVIIGGGVTANRRLREKLHDALSRAGTALHIPSMKLSTDNAAMIAAAGYFRAIKKDFTPWEKVCVQAQWRLGGGTREHGKHGNS